MLAPSLAGYDLGMIASFLLEVSPESCLPFIPDPFGFLSSAQKAYGPQGLSACQAPRSSSVMQLSLFAVPPVPRDENFPFKTAEKDGGEGELDDLTAIFLTPTFCNRLKF